MPNYNIHWKGYPQYRLPRIRVVSSRRNLVQSRSASASEHSSVTHSQIKNEKENNKRPFRIQFLRRRVRGSRASSSVVRARHRASVRAKHHIQVFGWDTPGAELASKAATEDIESRKRALNKSSRSGAPLQPGPRDSSELPSTDGAASSVARRLKQPRKKSENGYSLRHIAKVPVYWTADHPSARQESSYNPDQLYSAQRSGPLQAASNRIPSHRPTEASRRNDTRVDPLSPIASQRRIGSSRPQFKANTFRRATSQISPGRKDTGLSSPEFWEAVKDYTRQDKAKDSSSSSVRSIVQSLLSEVASRSPSQKKVLQRFTKGIELYLQAAKDHPSQSLISSAASASSASISAYTIQELKPYRSEFQSAGLAVTSAEQKGMAKLTKGLTPPQTPPKDNKYEKSRHFPAQKGTGAQKSSEKEKHPSYASGSTGTTVLGWTPPHEKFYGRPPVVERRRSSGSTDHTVIGFTPPVQMYPSPSKPAREAPAPPQTTAKKSLPWLRKFEPSPQAPPTQKRSIATVQPEQHRPSTPLTGWVSTFETPEPVQPVKKRSEPADNPRPGPTEKSMETKRGDFEYGTAQSTADNFITKMVTEMATQTGPSISIPLANLEIRPRATYVDLGIQTVDCSPVLSRRPTVHDDHNEDFSEIDRAPIPSSRSRTFPLSSNNCKGDCVQPLEKLPQHSLLQRSSRPSKVTWTGVDQEIQTAAMPGDSIDNPERANAQTPKITPSVQSKVVPGERTRTFPFATSPTRRIGPYRPLPISKSPNKSVDEGKSHWVENDREQGEEIPNQYPSPPPLCTQCAGPLHRELESEPKPEPMHEPPLQQQSAHACTARSSTQCQQCFPSRNSSIVVSPLQVTSPAECRSPIEVQYLLSRRSTRPMIPARPVGYPENTTSPAEAQPEIFEAHKSYRTPERNRTQSRAELSTVDTPKSSRTPERKRTQSKAEQLIDEYTQQEPMADPMKRPSLPILKLKPAISDPPKHVHCYSSASRIKTLPPLPKVPLFHTIPVPAFASTVSTDTCSLMSDKPNDKQVFKGLHVATAAACDEDIDKWIEEITGSSARKFLSALSAFDGLGANTLADVARRAAKQRRGKIDAWEAAREERVMGTNRRPRYENGDINEMEYMVGDQGVELAYQYAETPSEDQLADNEDMVYDQGVGKGRPGLTESMLKRREGKGNGGVKDRAAKMG
ncbi:hypothetical protein VTL71DRAFT_12166 [Oculimacula yallundae]|uniref:Uncharacterized protein n=1 Tax=Oculimacula yallundae TaxID=86028 RepID=A0ABR4CSR9_9HELO